VGDGGLGGSAGASCAAGEVGVAILKCYLLVNVSFWLCLHASYMFFQSGGIIRSGCSAPCGVQLLLLVEAGCGGAGR